MKNIMQPPCCIICNLSSADIPEDADLDDYFELVRFADYRIPPGAEEGWCGHPQGVDWFCSQHAKPALERTAMTLNDACSEIKAMS